MIDAVEITAFKRFSQLRIELGMLTVLTGLNGSGKSTVIQSLLLAHAASLPGANQIVPLSTESGLDLGEAVGLLNVDTEARVIEVVVLSDGPHRWTLDPGQTADHEARYLLVMEHPEPAPTPFGVVDSAFTYLAAERLGPRTSYQTSPLRPGDAVVGADGRYVAHALAVGARREVPEYRRHPSAGEVTTLVAQTEAWLTDLVGPIQLAPATVPNTDIATLRIRTPGRMGEWMLPTNTGFGVSYSLPVVVGGLLVPEGGLFIVDSPEAHLHPAAQSAVGAFLATVAASGTQVIVETHSDHVLNGIRKAVAAGPLEASSVRIHYFGQAAEPARLTIDPKGAISEWPSGFFDQIETDLADLVRSRRS